MSKINNIGVTRSYGIVRDKNGKPKFDCDIHEIPKHIWDNVLTEDDKRYLNHGRDALNRRT